MMGSSIFHCAMCGRCCEGKGGIILSDKDTARLAAYFNLPEREFLDLYTVMSRGKVSVKTGDDNFCVFFRKDTGCTVHSAKPDVCRAWPFFRGNLEDPVSLAMAKDFCRGIDRSATFEQFKAEGEKDLSENGLFARDPQKESNALLPAQR